MLETNIFSLPVEILAYIGSSFTTEEIIALKRTGKAFHQTVNAFDVLWQPLLNRLHAIDQHISTAEPTADGAIPSRQTRVNEGFRRIHAQQQEEIKHFLDPIEKNKTILPLDMQQKLREMNSPATQLSMLEERNTFLDEINANLIRLKINNSTTLVCGGLTRFPSSLFDDNDLQSYWQTLKYIIIQGTKLTELHLKCPVLRDLWVYNNQLRKLILECPALENLFAYNNKLTELSLQCPALKYLSVRNNQLRKLILEYQALVHLYADNNELTELILDCPALTNLDVSYNQLTELILDCPALTALQAMRNRLRTLHQSLREKLGDRWASETLDNQNFSDEKLADQPASFLPALEISKANAEGKKPDVTDLKVQSPPKQTKP